MAENDEVMLFGRFDASQVEKARKIFVNIDTSHTVSFKDLEYISSAGLGVLLETQKRLNEGGHRLRLKDMNAHVRDIFKWAGFDMIFEIEG
jgi:anti-sigma B factor antagonist